MITTRYGNEVEIVSAIHHGTEITGAVCKRVEDGATRSYLLGDLRAPNGAYEVYNAVCEAHARTVTT